MAEDLSAQRPDDKVIWEMREFIQDRQRIKDQPEDSKLERAARKYLKSRVRRIEIEREMDSKIDAFPYRLVENIRAQRFLRLGQYGELTKAERDYWTPSYARTVVDRTPNLPQPQ